MTKKKLKAFGTRLGVSNLTVYISRHASNDTKNGDRTTSTSAFSISWWIRFSRSYDMHVTLAVIENGNTIKACTK